MDKSKKMKFMCLGSNPAINALGKVMSLFGVKACDNRGCDILLMVDGDKHEESKSSELKKTFHGTEKIIYLESNDKDIDKHKLLFLTQICETYRIPLKRFSIVELGRIIVDISSSEVKQWIHVYTPPKSIPLVHKNSEELFNVFLDAEIDLSEFCRYLNNQRAYIEELLHGKKELTEENKENIVYFDYFFSRLKVPTDLFLNILVVENNIDEIKSQLDCLQKSFPFLRLLLIKNKFVEFKKEIITGNKYIRNVIDISAGVGSRKRTVSIKFEEIDLILQDIFLKEGEISGFDFAKLYFDVAPQAMVFFLTNMDVETLAASGYDKKVDRLIGKDRIIGLMKYYYDRFQELYGPILWPVFIEASQRVKTNAQLTDKTAVRQLLANIRTWTMEPGILFHGFALPEMVDHAFRHTSGLWKMTNRILGPFFERSITTMTGEDRILLSLAIWLHDIGHRGDEYHYDSMDIRDNHASISESLILKSSGAFGLDWLKEYCDNKKCKAEVHRNKTRPCNGGEAICPIRRLGLLCRYHQSNAPLTKEKLSNLILKKKMPSPYCIVGMNNFNDEIEEDSDKQIEQYLRDNRDFGWFGITVRSLGDFEDDDLLSLAGLLRWLDALHTHHEKVGSLLQVRSQFEYLAMRERYCNKRIAEIDDLLRKTETGSAAYLGFLDERFRLDSYSQLLIFQYIHIWRSGMVKYIYGEWSWNDEDARWNYRIVFQLFEKPFYMLDKDLKKETYKIPDDKESNSIRNSPIAFWINHVCKEIIEEEEESQTIKKKGILFEKYFNAVPLLYWCKCADGTEGAIKP